MKRLWLIPLFLALAGFTGLRMTGGSFAPVIPTPILITFSPTNPSIADNFVNGTQVASVLVTMSDSSAFNGSLGFSPPVTSGCAQNGNSSGLFGVSIPPTYAILTTRTGSSADDGTKLATVTATQNGGTACAAVSVLVQPANPVPAPAAAAGFNTLIISDNFQSPAFGNPVTNWLDCNDGSSPPVSPLYYRAWVGFGTNIDAPCNAVDQATDPSNGQLALHLHWQDSYFTGNNGHAHGIPVQTTDSAGNGRRTPMGFYIEFIARSSTQTGNFPGIDVWSYTHTNTDSYEIDGAEEAGATNVSFAIHNNDLANGSCADPGSSPPCAGAVVNITQYHTYAWRQTSAGSDIVFCAYVDGTLYGCNSISPVNAQLSSLQDMVQQMLIFVPGNYSTAGRTKEMYIKSMKVWSCAGVNSGNHCLSSSNNP